MRTTLWLIFNIWFWSYLQAEYDWIGTSYGLATYLTAMIVIIGGVWKTLDWDIK